MQADPNTPTQPPAFVPLSDPDSIISAQIRDWSKIIAGALVTHGLVAQGDVQLVIGALMGLASLAWSLWNTYRTTHFIAKASALPAGATRTEIAAAVAAPAVPTILTAVTAMSDADKAALAALLKPHLVPPPITMAAPAAEGRH